MSQNPLGIITVLVTVIKQKEGDFTAYSSISDFATRGKTQEEAILNHFDEIGEKSAARRKEQLLRLAESVELNVQVVDYTATLLEAGSSAYTGKR
jgi:hypothetical protein